MDREIPDWRNPQQTIGAFHGITISCVSHAVRYNLAMLLDIPNDRAADYMGLAEKLGFSTLEIQHLPYLQSIHGSNTLKLFEKVEAKGENSLFLQDLVRFLYNMGRDDVVKVLTEHFHDVLAVQRAEQQRKKEAYFSESQQAPIMIRARGPQPQYHVTEAASHVRATPCHVPHGHGHVIPNQGHVTPNVADHVAGNQSMAPNSQQPNTLTISTQCGCSLRVHGASGNTPTQTDRPPSYDESLGTIPPSHPVSIPTTTDIYASDRTELKTPSSHVMTSQLNMSSAMTSHMSSARPVAPSLFSTGSRREPTESDYRGETCVKSPVARAQSLDNQLYDVRQNGGVTMDPRVNGSNKNGRKSSHSSELRATTSPVEATINFMPVAQHSQHNQHTQHTQSHSQRIPDNLNVRNKTPHTQHNQHTQHTQHTSHNPDGTTHITPLSITSSDASPLPSLNLTVNDGPSSGSGNTTDSTALAESDDQPLSASRNFHFKEPKGTHHVPELDGEGAVGVSAGVSERQPSRVREVVQRPANQAYKYGPIFITYDLGPEGKAKVPLANLWQFLRNNGFHAHFDAYKLPAGLDWQDVKEESWARFKRANFIIVLITPSYKRATESSPAGNPTILRKSDGTEHRTHVSLISTWLRNECGNSGALSWGDGEATVASGHRRRNECGNSGALSGGHGGATAAVNRRRIVPVLADGATMADVPEWLCIECRDDRFYKHPSDHKEFIRELITTTKKLQN